jgi:hypothetical protein
MAEEGEDDGGFTIVDFKAVFEDEATANAGKENERRSRGAERQEQGPRNAAKEGQRA